MADALRDLVRICIPSLLHLNRLGGVEQIVSQILSQRSKKRSSRYRLLDSRPVVVDASLGLRGDPGEQRYEQLIQPDRLHHRKNLRLRGGNRRKKTSDEWLRGDAVGAKGQSEEIDFGHKEGDFVAFTVKLTQPDGQKVMTFLIGKMAGGKIIGTFVDDAGTRGEWTGSSGCR